jgi:hypothetical protein
MRKAIKILVVVAVISAAFFLYSCGMIGPSTEIILKDAVGNTYSIPVEINGKVYYPNDDGKILVRLEDGAYDLKLVGAEVFEPNYSVVIKNGVGEVILKKAEKPAASILVKNGERILVVANLSSYKGKPVKGVEAWFNYAGDVEQGWEVSEGYMGVYSNKMAFFGVKKGGHLSDWMELPAPKVWKNIEGIFVYEEGSEKKIPVE